MMKKVTRDSLFKHIRKRSTATAWDNRKPEKRIYSFESAVMTAFSAFYLQQPSFLRHEENLRKQKFRKNIQKLFCARPVTCMQSDHKEVWKQAKYALLKNRENLTVEQEQVLKRVLKISPALKVRYELKESFREIFNVSDDRETGSKKLSVWIFDVIRQEASEYYGFVKTLLNWKENILNYFDEWVSGGFVEGINNKIKLIKRKAFGFVNFENFRIKIIDSFS